MKKTTLLSGTVSLPQNLLKKLLLSCFAMVTLLSSYATSYTSVGGNWNTPASWSPVGVPGVGDLVTISTGTITVNIATAVCSGLTISGGTLVLQNAVGGLTVDGPWLFNSGTFTPNQQTVTFGTGGSIGGSIATVFRNLTISTTNPTDIVTLLTSGVSITNSSGGGILTLNKGIFDIGTGNTLNMAGGGGGNTINNPNATGTSNLATTGTNGSDAGTVNFTSGNPVTINGPGLTSFFNLSSSSNPQVTISSPNSVLINGTMIVGTASTHIHFTAGTNSPIYGSASNLLLEWNSASYVQGPEWTATSGFIAGTTPGYPNNVTLTGFCCGQTSTIANNTNINGVLTLGNGTGSNDNNIFGANFSCGGIVITAGEKITAPSGNMIVNGSWSRATGSTYITSNGTVSFGAGSCTTPNTITGPSSPIGGEMFYNMAIINNAYITLNSEAQVSNIFTLTSGILTTSTADPLVITSTSTSAVTGGSTTSYVNGPINWSLQAAAGNYTFPVGSGICTTQYLPFTLNKVASSAVTGIVQAFGTASGGVGDITLGNLIPTEYWSLTTSASLPTGSTVSVASPGTIISPYTLIAESFGPTASGSYTSLAGTPNPTVNPTGVTGSNNIGTGSTFFVTLGSPPIVTTLPATSITTTSVTLNGAFNTQGTSLSTSFNYGTTTAYGTSISSINSPINSTTSIPDSAHITGLTANTVYDYIATDGVNSGSNVIFITAPNPPVVGTPNTPTVDGFTATWSAPAAMGSAPYTYTIEVSTDSTFTTGVTTQTLISSGSTSYTFTTLNSATQYYYRVKAVNATASSVWSATSAPISTLIVPTPVGCTTGSGSSGSPGAISKTSVLPVIDGLSDADSVWANVPANYITNESVPTQTATTDSSRTWKAMWTTDSLYFFIQITDPTLISQNTNAGAIGAPNTGVPVAGATPGTSSNLYDFDGVEIDLAPDGILTGGYNGVNDIQLRFNLGAPTVSGQSCGCATQFSGTIFNRVQSHIDFKVIPVAGGYNVEAAIPWGQNGANPGIDSSTSGGYNTVAAGDNIGIEVQVNDANSTAGRNFQYSWYNTSQTPYQNPTTFAEAELLPAAACPIPPTVISPTAVNITATGATLGATVVSSGDAPTLTARGTGVSTSPDATGTSNALPEGGTAISTYSGPTRTGLAPQTKYYFLGYATNANNETGVSNVDSFFTLSALPATQPTLSACGANNNLVLNWSAVTFPPTSEATNTGYLILRRQDGTNPTTAGISTRIATVQSALPAGTTLVATITNGSTVSYTDATAISGTTYNYLLVPYTWDGVTADSTYNYFITAAPTVTAGIGAGTTPVVTIGSISSPIDLGTQIPLVGNTTVAGTVSWTVSPSAPIADTSSLSTTSTPTAINSYTYTLTVNAGGCVGSARTTVNVVNAGCLVIPNAFTPNGDGINDTWIIQSSCYTNLTVDVYDRWGSLMYHSDNYGSANAWDGKYQGKNVPDATYYYVVKATSATDSPTKKGSLTILR